MQYSVPQFVMVEDKIIGPLTKKQFMYIIACAAALFVIWSFTDIELFLVFAVPIVAFFMALTFYKVNGRPFSDFVKYSWKFLSSPKLRVWKRGFDPAQIKTSVAEDNEKNRKEEIPEIGKKITESRLKRLSYDLDTEGGVNEAVFKMKEGEEPKIEKSDLTPKKSEEKKTSTKDMTAQERQQKIAKLIGRA